ncbi:porin family protein [Flavobacterium sp. N1994]|uniref:porin family protein n=1 Tax=Flavobacterium sp. N1994 TaxID=2986827 RepID=UPI0022231093|nr:porin family protein [Flavobacterium sp. N1994]
MKNLFVTAMLLVFGLTMAQNSSPSKASKTPIKFGLKLGLNIANLTNTEDGSSSVSPRTGINLGGYLHYKVAEKWALQPELLYTTQGNIVQSNNVKVTYMLDYIAIPLMAKYYPAKGFNVEFGPQLSFIVSKKAKGESNGQSTTIDLDELFAASNLNAKVNTFDLGLNFGLGYELKNGINFSGRYTLGMLKVFKGADVVYSNGSEQVIKNSVFSFGMGFTFK